MTLLYSNDGTKTITFRTNDDYPHANDYKTDKPFHLFRVEKKDDFRNFGPAIIYRLLKLAISRYEGNEMIKHATDWPDIVDYVYEKITFEDIKMSCFEIDDYYVAATLLMPEMQND